MNAAFLSFLLAILVLSGKVIAAPPCKELNGLWQERFHSDFKIAWNTKRFACPSPDAKIAKALYDIYKPALNFNFYRWATSLVKSTVYDASCSGAVANMTSTGKMTLCPAFFTDSETSRAGTMVHEAAHARDEDPRHVTCTRGYAAGAKGACDDKLYDTLDGSGYNHEFFYFRHLLAQNNYNELRREEIRYFMKYMVLNRFNKVTKKQVREWADG